MTESHDFCNERFRHRGYTSGVYLASVDLDDKPSAKRWSDGVGGLTNSSYTIAGTFLSQSVDPGCILSIYGEFQTTNVHTKSWRGSHGLSHSLFVRAIRLQKCRMLHQTRHQTP